MSTQSLLNTINNTPDLLSILYDLGLPPEQLRKGTEEWQQMEQIAKEYLDEINSNK